MATTARIFLVDTPWLHGADFDLMVDSAKHRPFDASLFVYSGGHPRVDGGHGVLDVLERAFVSAPPRILSSARDLAAYIVVDQAPDDEAEVADYGFTYVPANPTVGAITFYEYLVVCLQAGAPRVFVQLGCLWRTEEAFAESQAEDDAAFELLMRGRHPEDFE